MVLDVNPVAHVAALAVQGNRLAGESVGDGERDEFFGKLIGTVVVGAAGNQDRLAMGVKGGAHQEVGAGLGSGIRGIGGEGAGFGEAAFVAERAVHFVGRDV